MERREPLAPNAQAGFSRHQDVVAAQPSAPSSVLSETYSSNSHVFWNCGSYHSCDGSYLTVDNNGTKSNGFRLSTLKQAATVRGPPAPLSSPGLAKELHTSGMPWHQTADCGTQAQSSCSYWEIELTSDASGSESTKGHMFFMIGAVDPDLDLECGHAGDAPTKRKGNGQAYYLHAHDGSLWGQGARGSHAAGALKVGDRVGVLVQAINPTVAYNTLQDWGGGTERNTLKSKRRGRVRFFVNGVEHGPGFSGDIVGPLVLGVEMGSAGQAVTLVPFAHQPSQRRCCGCAGFMGLCSAC